jgi:hypothetical protein
MRNKWYVIGCLVPAAALAYVAVRTALGEYGPLLSLVPALLALAMIGAAVQIARSADFAPAAKERWDSGTTAGVATWMKHREDADAAKQTMASSNPPAAKP